MRDTVAAVAVAADAEHGDEALRNPAVPFLAEPWDRIYNKRLYKINQNIL